MKNGNTHLCEAIVEYNVKKFGILGNHRQDNMERCCDGRCHFNELMRCQDVGYRPKENFVQCEMNFFD